MLSESGHMDLWEDRFESGSVQPKTLRFCPVCQKETAHEVRSGSGVVARICVPCLSRALAYELDRE
jgi:hypothetical protein